MKLFKKVFFSDSVMNRFQDNVQSAVDPLLKLPISDGVLLEGIALVSGVDNDINHTLGRQPRLWFVADIQQDANVWRDSWTSAILTLRTDANCTIALWVG